MTTTTTAKKLPDYLAFVPIQRTGQPTKYAKVGVGFTYRNGSIGLLYDAIALSGQIVLVGIDDELPETVSYGAPSGSSSSGR
jgi:hypothetical protein